MIYESTSRPLHIGPVMPDRFALPVFTATLPTSARKSSSVKKSEHPVLFVEHGGKVNVWRPGPRNAECVRRDLSRESLRAFVEEAFPSTGTARAVRCHGARATA